MKSKHSMLLDDMMLMLMRLVQMLRLMTTRVELWSCVCKVQQWFCCCSLARVVFFYFSYYCKTGGGLIQRHDAIQQEVKALAISAGVQASSCCKDVVVLNEAGGDARRGDLLLPQCGKNGMNLLLDFTIAHPVSESYIEATRQDPASAMKRANARKITKYKERAAANDIDFMPMALECYGALSKDFISVLHMLCEKRAEITGSNKSILMQYWYRRISCTLHKGNSRAILKRCMEITQDTASARDECYDNAIDHEFSNVDTATLHR